MKNRIVLFLICLNINYSFAGANKQVLLKDFRSVFITDEIDLKQDSQDLLFQYQVYKKLIQDNFLDQLIIDSGFEPNQETRSIFFSALTIELQDVIKKSFSDFIQNSGNQAPSNNSGGTVFSGIDPNLFLQAEMTRNFSTALASLSNTKEFKIKNLIIGGLILYLITKFNVIREVVKTSFNYLKAKDNIVAKTSPFISFIDSSINQIGLSAKGVLSRFIPVDYSKNIPSSSEFFKFYEHFETVLKSDDEFVKNKALHYEYIDVVYKTNEGVSTYIRLSKNPNLKLD